ncbi:MAG: dihydropteroate synthase [Flavobacteriaceae bacterium]|nr:dihydropteroate synthase [Flavobacteriaceae bacterium]NVJ72365.1 dihydropteroate synthase [Flavobacteriaceae bacterium]
MTLNCRGRLVDLSTPKIMGIINATPDSFYSKSRVATSDDLKIRIEQMIEDGVDIIDIGAYSSRPNAEHISQEEELNRLLPLVEFIKKDYPNLLVSIDTFRAKVADECIQRGAELINDISGGQIEDELLEVIANKEVPYILMHMRGTPQTMMQYTQYEHLANELLLYFSKGIQKAKKAGIKDVIIDPGFGFSKTLEQNYQLLNNLELLNSLEAPLLIGISRKSMISKALNTTAEKSLNGTTALHMIALSKGAKILRVHDVKEAVECVKLHQLLNSSNP